MTIADINDFFNQLNIRLADENLTIDEKNRMMNDAMIEYENLRLSVFGVNNVILTPAIDDDDDDDITLYNARVDRWNWFQDNDDDVCSDYDTDDEESAIGFFDDY